MRKIIAQALYLIAVVIVTVIVSLDKDVATDFVKEMSEIHSKAESL